MKERRANFSVGVTYDTPSDKLARLSGQIQQIIENEELARFDRGNLALFGDSAIIFQFVYFMRNPAYAVYMDTQEQINLAIVDLFEKEGLEFAFPTQTLHVESLPSAPSISTQQS
jgi:small-conductance mechanosensitive channel